MRWFELTAGLGLLLLSSAPMTFAQVPNEPSDYNVEQWFTQPDISQLKWSARVEPAELSVHQRLFCRAEIVIDGKELAKRRGRGRMVFFVRVQDSEGRVIRRGTSIDLSKVEEGVKGEDLQFLLDVFVLPGDYQFWMGLADTETGQHSTAHRRTHVTPLHNDPLPASWTGLPTMEFLPADQAPDSWYLPEIDNRLNLPVATDREFRLELLMNLTPSEQSTLQIRQFARNMGALVPGMRVLSRLRAPHQTLNATILDLSKHKVAWAREKLRGLNWWRIRQIFDQNDAGRIDAKALALHSQERAFLREQIEARLNAEGPSPVMIVLSAPLFLESQEETRPIEVGADNNRQVFYIRCWVPPITPRQMRTEMARRVGRGMAPVPMFTRSTPIEPDEIERMLRPVRGRVFTVTSPEEFRRAVAAIIAGIERPGSAGSSVTANH